MFAAGTSFAALTLVGGDELRRVPGRQLGSKPVVSGFQNVYTALMPLANGDQTAAGAGGSTTVDVAANDRALDGSLAPDSIEIVGRPLHGTAVVNPDGTVTYTADNSAATADSFRYTIRNSAGLVSNAAVVSVTRSGGTPSTAGHPVPTITTTAGSQTHLTSIPFTVTFDKDVTGFTLADLVLTNGTASNFVAANARTYTFTVTPTAAGTVTVGFRPGPRRTRPAGTASSRPSRSPSTTSPRRPPSRPGHRPARSRSPSGSART